MAQIPLIEFTDDTYNKTGRSIFRKIQKLANSHNFDLAFPIVHVKEGHLYIESVLTLKNKSQFDLPLAIELNEVIVDGHPHQEVAEFAFKDMIRCYENALDTYGDNWKPEF